MTALSMPIEHGMPRLEVISRVPDAGGRRRPLLFVHGAWHGAWCWSEHFLDYFAARGFASHAVSLRGHGASDGRSGLRWTRIADYVTDVARVIDALPQEPIIVAHSMGAFVLQKLLESRQAPACVLLAPVPPRGAARITTKMLRRHPMQFLRGNLTLSLYPVVENEALVRDAFFSLDLAPPLLARYSDRMQDESYRGFLDMLMLDLPRRRLHRPPTLVLAAGRDSLFDLDEVQATARTFGVEAEVVPDIAHDMMLDTNWREVAGRISAWLDRQEVAA